MTRRSMRIQLFKLLFRFEFNAPDEMDEQAQLFFDAEESVDEDSQAEIQEKCNKIIDRIEELDELLNEKTTGWKTNRMGKVELTILRVALYEILYDETVPTNVAINEAVEIAKKYGQDGAPAFINGVLAKFTE